MDIVLEIVFWAIGGFLEGIAGLLWPSKNATVRRLQRICLVTLLAGLACLGFAVAALFFATAMEFFVLLAMAIVCFIGCGLIGNKIESICKADGAKGK